MTEKWKVIKIVDEYRIVVNAGEKDLIEKGEELEVYEIGEPIIDPQTNEDLGTLDIIKARIVVSIVYEKMCICKNIEKENIGLGNNLQAVFGYSANKRLPVNTEEISGGYNDNIKIRVGDKVRKALG